MNTHVNTSIVFIIVLLSNILDRDTNTHANTFIQNSIQNEKPREKQMSSSVICAFALQQSKRDGNILSNILCNISFENLCLQRGLQSQTHAQTKSTSFSTVKFIFCSSIYIQCSEIKLLISKMEIHATIEDFKNFEYFIEEKVAIPLKKYGIIKVSKFFCF